MGAATAYSFLYFFFFSNFQTLNIFVTRFQELWGLDIWILLHMWTEWMYRVYRNQAVAAYSSLYFFIFLSLQYSNI